MEQRWLEEAKDRLVIALDLRDLEKVRQLARSLRGVVSHVKINSKLMTAVGGLRATRILLNLGFKVFYDAKFHEIPAITADSVAEAAGWGVSMITLHTMGTIPMMVAARSALDALEFPSGFPRPKLIGVTVLTSSSHADFKEIGFMPSVPPLIAAARHAKLDGVVVPADEMLIPAVRETLQGSGLLTVSPGIRPLWPRLQDDQKHVVTPSAAIAAGSDILVVGRPVLGYPAEQGGPAEAARLILAEMAEAIRLKAQEKQ